MPFLVFRRDHLRSASGIICGSGSFAIWGSFAVRDHLGRCTKRTILLITMFHKFLLTLWSQFLSGMIALKGKAVYASKATFLHVFN